MDIQIYIYINVCIFIYTNMNMVGCNCPNCVTLVNLTSPEKPFWNGYHHGGNNTLSLTSSNKTNGVCISYIDLTLVYTEGILSPLLSSILHSPRVPSHRYDNLISIVSYSIQSKFYNRSLSILSIYI